MSEHDARSAAVQARLERVITTQDLSPVLEEETLDEARELALTLTNDSGSLPTRYVLGWLHWYRCQALPDGDGQQDLRTAIAMFTPCFIGGISDLPGPLLPFMADLAGSTAMEMLAMTPRSADQKLLSSTTRLWQRIVTATPVDHPERPGRLSNLGIALAALSEGTGAQSALDAAVEAGQEAVRTAADHSDRGMYLSNLGVTLLTRFELTGAETDLDAAIETRQQAVEATPAEHPHRAGRLTNLGVALLARFERTEVKADLNAAIAYLQEAVQAAPLGHPDHDAYLTNLEIALATRFNRAEAETDLDAAIANRQQAVQAIPADHPDRAGRLSSLANALLTRFERTDVETDLNAAIAHFREAAQAAPAGHPDRSTYLENLGVALATRFERTGAEADLDAAIEAEQQALQMTSADHPDRGTYLANLGGVLGTRFERTGAEADLDAAVIYLQEAVQTAPADHPNRGTYLANLGVALAARFRRTGAEADLDAAIEAGQHAVRATSVGHPNRDRYLSNLGDSLRTRFARTGSETDLNAAIAYLQEAVQTAPIGHLDRAMRLSNLGIALLTRFRRTGVETDLNQGIAYLGEAVQITPADHPNHAKYLTNLTNTLLTRFERTGSETDLESAIETGQLALLAAPADHPLRAAYLTNLANALFARFERTASETDLESAIETRQQAVLATPADQPDRASHLSNLANSLVIRGERDGTTADLAAAFEMYKEATYADAAPASDRIRAGQAAALLAARTDPGIAASVLDAAVLLLPEVAPRYLERGDQQYAIGMFPGLAADAAALALADPAVPELQRPARALRLLEGARGVLLSQALSTRGDLSQLRTRHPEIAARFIELRNLLDKPSAVSDIELANTSDDRDASSLQHALHKRRQANAEFNHLFTRIRNLEGFGAFGLPPSIEQLQAQADQGPVVVFNVSSYRSDAILLTAGGITRQRLPGLDLASLTGQISIFYQALDTITANRPLQAQNRAQDAIRGVLTWLWENAAGPVLNALGYHAPPASGEPWPRLWWVPGGLLSLLPIHAAGLHNYPPDLRHRTVMDRVISSYTPTIGALAHARTTVPGMTSRSLIVAMPTTPDLPGEGRLTYVPAEAAMLRARLPHPIMLAAPSADHPITGAVPTKAAVMEQLPGCAIAHFACHAYTDAANPSQSRLILYDHSFDPLTVAALAPLALDNAQLAFLSACGTARTADTRLLDEAIHLTSAFQLAGFPHVIGTLWEINDATAVEIADTFYAALTKPDGTLDPRRAASALHHATRIQRDQRPGAPYLWASHIHAGA